MPPNYVVNDSIDSNNSVGTLLIMYTTILYTKNSFETTEIDACDQLRWEWEVWWSGWEWMIAQKMANVLRKGTKFTIEFI